MNAELSTFFEATAAVSATVLGLILVTFTLQRSEWTRRSLRRAVATVTLAEILNPLLFALIYLAPGHHWHWGGRAVGTLGYLSLVNHLRIYRRTVLNAPSVITRFDRAQLWGIAVTLVTFSVMFFDTPLTLKALICVWFIFSGSSEAWLLMRDPS